MPVLRQYLYDTPDHATGTTPFDKFPYVLCNMKDEPAPNRQAAISTAGCLYAASALKKE